MTVAILIPTRNRPDFIERTLAYYDSLKSEHPVYIGDASDPEIAARIETFARTLEHVKVRYFHWEGVRAKETTVKLAQCAQAESPYCALHGDDDYFVPSSLSRCAEFLSVNPDYRTAQGRAARFGLDRPGPFGELQYIGDYWGVNALEQESSVERLDAFARKYFVAAFSTHRTDEFVRDSEHYAAVKDDGFGELIHCYTFAIRGKSKFFDCLYMVRQGHEGVYHPGTLEWIVQEHWSAEYHRTIEVLGRALAEASGPPPDQARQLVSDVFKAYLNRYLVSDLPRREGNSALAALRKALPSRLKRMVRRLISQTMDAGDMRVLGSRRSRFHDQFLPVARSLVRTRPHA